MLVPFWAFIPFERRRIESRVFLGAALVLCAIPCMLLLLLYVNFTFLGPRDRILQGVTSQPSTAPKTDSDGVVLKLMTYNIWMGGAYKGAWKFESADRVADRIQKIGSLVRLEAPDILFLQEVVFESGPGSIDQTPLLAESSGMYAWAFGQCLNDGLPFYRFIEGNAILSRWPLHPFANQKMSGKRTFYQIASDDQSTLWCKTRIGSQEVLLASVHLTSGGDDVNQQISQLLDYQPNAAAVLAGDFNCKPYEKDIQRVVDSNRFITKLDGDYTVPSQAPRKTIDYIFVPPDWQLLDHRVIQTNLSDHLPVVATYKIPSLANPNR